MLAPGKKAPRLSLGCGDRGGTTCHPWQEDREGLCMAEAASSTGATTLFHPSRVLSGRSSVTEPRQLPTAVPILGAVSPVPLVPSVSAQRPLVG